ncbi:MAG: type 4a pilus biogenesis protein PilO [bacterium]
MKNSTATILLLISVGLFYTFTSPQYADVKNLRAESAEYKKVLDGAIAISETTDAIQDEYEKISKEEVERLNKVLPDNIDTVHLALDLDTMASQYGISIKNVKVDKNMEDNTSVISSGNSGLPYEKVNVTFSFISNYASFSKFLTDIEKSLRIIDVRSISFQTSDVGLYEHRISVETYWLK